MDFEFGKGIGMGKNYCYLLFLLLAIFGCNSQENKESDVGFKVKKSFNTTKDFIKTFQYNVDETHIYNDSLDKEDSIIRFNAYGKREGECVFYFQNHKDSVNSNYKNGEFHGNMEVYYPNGNLKQRLNWYHGKFIGKNSFYYPDGTLEAEFYVMTISGKMNTYKKVLIDENGSKEIFQEMIVSLSRNTVPFGDSIEVKIRTNKPVGTKYRLDFGYYNDIWTLIDSTNYIYQEGLGSQTTFKIVGIKEGLNVMRGFFLDIISLKREKDEKGIESIVAKAKINYFDTEFYVEDSIPN